MPKQFTRTVEDFVCENCGTKIIGNGFTNHCSQCLYSKHVDVNPGDRAEMCGGLMKPVSVIKKGDEYSVFQRCVRCGFERRNKVLTEDNFEVLLSISKGD